MATTFQSWLMIQLQQDAEGVQLMDRYLIHNCPRCRGLMGVTVQGPEGTALQAVNGKCVRCRHRLAWIVIRGNRTQRTRLYPVRLRAQEP